MMAELPGGLPFLRGDFLMGSLTCFHAPSRPRDSVFLYHPEATAAPQG